MTDLHAIQPPNRVSRLVALTRSAASRFELVPLSLIAIVLAVLYWPRWSLVPEDGLDNSWRVGLTWAHQLGLGWGTDVIFTYGPLYFLDYPLANSRAGILLASLAWIAYVAVLTACVFALTNVRHRQWSKDLRLGVTIGATALLLAISSFTSLQNLHVLVPIGLVLVVLAAVTRNVRIAWFVGGACGLLLAHKLSDAALVGAIAVVCVGTSLGLRGLTRMALATAGVFILSWLIGGQALSQIPAYIASEANVMFGFAAAMNVEQPGLLWHYPVAIVLGLAVLYCARMAVSNLKRWQRIGFSAGIALGLWVAAREAFTRHDGHYWFFFGVVLILCIILAFLALDRRALATALCVGVAADLVIATVGLPLLGPIDRQTSIAAANRVLGAISSGGYAQELLSDAKQQLVQRYKITPELAQKLRDAPTLVDSWNISALFAVDAMWRPLPVLQTYAAYTTDLGALSEQSLVDMPRQVLRSVPYGSIDGRNPYWDLPQFQRLLYCSYTVTDSTQDWLLMAPAGERCDVPEPLPSVVAAAGQLVPVPARAGSMTVVTITPMESPLDRAIEFLTKPHPIYVQYGPRSWRLAPGAAQLMLNTPVPNAAFDGSPGVPFQTISVTQAAQLDFAFVTVR